MDEPEFTLFASGDEQKKPDAPDAGQTPRLQDIVTDSADVPRKQSKLAFAGLTVGAVSFVLSFCIYFMVQLFGVLGLAYGFLCFFAGVTAQVLGIVSLVITRGREKLLPALAIVFGALAVLVFLFMLLLVSAALQAAAA